MIWLQFLGKLYPVLIQKGAGGDFSDWDGDEIDAAYEYVSKQLAVGELVCMPRTM